MIVLNGLHSNKQINTLYHTDIYSCPFCSEQTSGPKSGLEWVRCPMYNNEFICEGCCIDLQGDALMKDFYDPINRKSFDKIVPSTTKSIEELRIICVRHQKEILETYVEGIDYQEFQREEYLSYLNEVNELLVTL